MASAAVSTRATAETIRGVDAATAEQVRAYQPPWTPGERELRGIVVAIDPAGGGSGDAEARRRDDLCLWAASHLYHLVRLGGGVPVLLRPDDRPAGRAALGRPAQVLVRIRTGPVQEPAASVAGSGELAEALARSLVAAGLSALDPAGPDAGVPDGADICLPDVDARRVRVGAIPAHRAWAEQVYRGLAVFAAGHRSRLRTASRPEEDGGEAPVPFYPRLSPESPFRRAASAVWTGGPLPAEKAAWFCEMYTRQSLSDRTNIYFEPQVSVEAGTAVIRGATSQSALLKTIERAVRNAGLRDCRSEMRLLPEQGHLERDRWFGVCIAPMALDYARPADGVPLQSQLLYGEPLFLLDRRDGFYLVQGADGYWGWVRENCVRTLTRDEFREYTDRPLALLMKDLAREAGRIVRGARLPVRPAGAGLELLLPDGGRLAVAPDAVRLLEESAAGAARARAALEMLEVPYLFAGRSSIGLDCSGLVGTVCERFGTTLPRDAAQQYVSGRLVATRWYREGLRVGDRIYFLNETGKIFHTGLSLGGDHFVHSSPPAVQISSLHSPDRLYREHWDIHFAGARRP
jgi:hypothetical protein